MQLALLLFVYAAIVGYEVPRLLRDQQWRELAAFAALMAIAVGVSLPLALDIKLPSPTTLILQIFGPLNRVLVGKGSA